VKVVDRVRVPAVPVTVTVTAAIGVVGAVVIVIVVLHAGLQLPGENAAVAPVGKPDAEKLTACDTPESNAAEIVDVVAAPCITDLLPSFDSEKLKVGEFTVSVRLVERLTAPAAPVTVMVAGPTGVDGAVVIVIVVLHAGLQLAGENDADAPVGRPDAEKLTGCVAPATKAAEIVDVAADPCVTDLLPSFDSEKSNGTPWVVADADGESVDVFPA
jgi:hypothetical protein